jgi:hypothetical protein
MNSKSTKSIFYFFVFGLSKVENGVFIIFTSSYAEINFLGTKRKVTKEGQNFVSSKLIDMGIKNP